MAFPTIPTTGASRVLVANQLDNSGTRTFPSLTGLTKNAGDLLIAIIVAYQSSTTDAQFSSWGGSFNEFHDTGTSTTLAIGMAYKWSTGSETGTFTVTQAATVTGDASMILLSIPGAHASTPPEAGSRVSGTTSAADPGSFNPGGWDAEDTLWVSVVGSGLTNISGAWDATGTTAPSNFTSRVDTNASDTSVVGDCEAAVSFRQQNAASQDVGTAGVDTSNARNASVVIAVRPAPTNWSGAATVDGTGTITGAGTRATTGAATVDGAGTVTAAGVRATFSGAITIEGTGTINAAGAREVISSAITIDGVGTVAGAGLRETFGQITVAGTGTVAADGTVEGGVTEYFGVVTVEGTGTLTAAGTRETFGVITVEGVGAVTADGTVEAGTGVDEYFGATELVGVSTVSASGEVRHPVMFPQGGGAAPRSGSSTTRQPPRHAGSRSSPSGISGTGRPW